MLGTWEGKHLTKIQSPRPGDFPNLLNSDAWFYNSSVADIDRPTPGKTSASSKPSLSGSRIIDNRVGSKILSFLLLVVMLIDSKGVSEGLGLQIDSFDW